LFFRCNGAHHAAGGFIDIFKFFFQVKHGGAVNPVPFAQENRGAAKFFLVNFTEFFRCIGDQIIQRRNGRIHIIGTFFGFFFKSLDFMDTGGVFGGKHVLLGNGQVQVLTRGDLALDLDHIPCLVSGCGYAGCGIRA